MTSSFILGSVWVEKVENRNFFVFHPICLKFGIVGNFEMLITKRKLKLKLENDLSKKFAIFYRFKPKLYKALFNNSAAMATVDVPWYWFVFKTKAYQYMVKVTKFELPTVYRFSTAEGRPSLWVDSAPPPGLFRVNVSAQEREDPACGWIPPPWPV